jgi:hypothetical protein
MPVHWDIDTLRQLFVVTAEGDVTRADIDDMLDALEDAGATRYCKLFDATEATTRMDTEELLAIGARIRSLQHGAVGPLAFVMQKHRLGRLARLLGILAAARRPMRLFEQSEPARRWLEGQPPAAVAAD